MFLLPMTLSLPDVLLVTFLSSFLSSVLAAFVCWALLRKEPALPPLVDDVKRPQLPLLPPLPAVAPAVETASVTAAEAALVPADGEGDTEEEGDAVKENVMSTTQTPPPRRGRPMHWNELVESRKHVASTGKRARGRPVERSVACLRDHVRKMQKEVLFTNSHSLYVSDWTFELEAHKSKEDLEDLEPGADDPTDNVAVMLERIETARAFVEATFAWNSGVYVGKTTKAYLPNRFSRHKEKASDGGSVIMLVIGGFLTAPTCPPSFESGG